MLFRKRSQKLKRYAIRFCDQVRNDFPRKLWTTDNPVIKFYRLPGAANSKLLFGIGERNNKGLFIIEGFYNDERKEVEIYNTTKEKTDNLRRTIRHECIHFLLNKSGLPYKDSDDLFLLLAFMYDAKPYGLLKREDLLNQIMEI